jgi:hypothetical protein
VQHSVADAIPFAPVPGILQQSQDGMFARILANDRCRIVTRSVIHHDDFNTPAALRGVIENFVQRACDARAFVVSRKDNAISCRFQFKLSAFRYQLGEASHKDCSQAVKPEI